MTTINPYLTFDGNCEAAFEFYQTVFGGEFAFKGRFKEMPSQEGMPPMSDEIGELIMHISLPIGEGTVLMGSDTSEHFGQKLEVGNNFSISVNASDKSEAERIFNALADGGKITMPLNDTFWGAYFGMCTDRFGIQWMINCELRPAE